LIENFTPNILTEFNWVPPYMM